MAKTTGKFTDWKSLRKAFLKAGYTIENRNGHDRWMCPQGFVIASVSPKDKYAIKNHLAMLIKYGADL